MLVGPSEFTEGKIILVSFMCMFRPSHRHTDADIWFQMHTSYMITLFYGCHGNVFD